VRTALFSNVRIGRTANAARYVCEGKGEMKVKISIKTQPEIRHLNAHLTQESVEATRNVIGFAILLRTKIYHQLTVYLL